MAKQAKTKTYIVRGTIDDINLRFYEAYDPAFLFNKALTLHSITTDKDRFTEALGSREDMRPYINDQYFGSLRAELHFLESHQFEAFFALILAAFQDKPHWLYLTEYTNAQVKTAAQQFIDEDIAALTGGMLDNERAFARWAFYYGHEPVDDALTDWWHRNLDNACWLVRRMAKRYLTAPEYNGYKHGMRIMARPSSWSLGDPEDPIIHQESEDSITYLDVQDIGEGGLTLREVTKQFNPTESFYYLEQMYYMLLVMTKVRHAKFAGVTDLNNLPVRWFADLDKDFIERLSVGNASLTMAL